MIPRAFFLLLFCQRYFEKIRAKSQILQTLGRRCDKTAFHSLELWEGIGNRAQARLQIFARGRKEIRKHEPHQQPPT